VRHLLHHLSARHGRRRIHLAAERGQHGLDSRASPLMVLRSRKRANACASASAWPATHARPEWYVNRSSRKSGIHQFASGEAFRKALDKQGKPARSVPAPATADPPQTTGECCRTSRASRRRASGGAEAGSNRSAMAARNEKPPFVAANPKVGCYSEVL